MELWFHWTGYRNHIHECKIACMLKKSCRVTPFCKEDGFLSLQFDKTQLWFLSESQVWPLSDEVLWETPLCGVKHIPHRPQCWLAANCCPWDRKKQYIAELIWQDLRQISRRLNSVEGEGTRTLEEIENVSKYLSRKETVERLQTVKERRRGTVRYRSN